jgi:hypothetical protein
MKFIKQIGILRKISIQLFIFFLISSISFAQITEIKENKEFQAIIQIKNWLDVGWGNQYHCEVLEVKKGEIPQLLDFKRGTLDYKLFTLGLTDLDLKKGRPAEGEKYLMTFYHNGLLTKHSCIHIRCFADALERVWYIKDMQKITPSHYPFQKGYINLKTLQFELIQCPKKDRSPMYILLLSKCLNLFLSDIHCDPNS